jgi:thioester reductase-like protein
MSEPSKATRASSSPASPRRRRSDGQMPARVVLLTGYPGFIGRRLVETLLQQEPQTQVVALVEETQLLAARRNADQMDASSRKRLQLLTGDVVSMDLGLSGEEFRDLTARVTHIFHLAGNHGLRVEPARAEAVNVGGTRSVLEFARECKALQRLTHFSSCYVSGDRIGVITEDELSMGQRFRNVYEATKYRAEVLVRSAMEDLPITVLRPSIVVGDSRTGEMDRVDGLYGVGVMVVLSPAFSPLPLPGDGVAPLNMVPVNFVVDAALAISRDKRGEGRTFHVVDPNPLASRTIYEMMAHKAGRRGPPMRISTGLTRVLIRVPGLEYLAPQGVQTLHYLNHLAIYNSPNTLEILHGTGVMCPRFDSYADRLLAYLRGRMKGQAPSAATSEDPLDVEGHRVPHTNDAP